MKRILLMVLLLAFVSGCVDTGQSYDQYRKGTQGIVMSFVDSAPPNTVFDKDRFIIGVKAKNMGAESANVNFYLSGYDPDVIAIDRTESLKLDGKVDVYNPQEGESNMITFEQTSTNLREADIYKPTFMVTACYDNYKTVAQAQVCLNGNPSFNKGVCTVGDVSLGGGQGGPVGVTKVEVAATPRRTNFKIHIKNFGSGGPCDKGQAGELEYVKVSSVKVHGKDIKSSCKPLKTQGLRLIDGEGVLYCDMAVDLDVVYPTPLVVTLVYDYSTSITRSVEIIKAPS